MDYIDPDTFARYPLGRARQKLPNGNVCLTPLDAATALAAGLLPVEENKPPLTADEVMAEPRSSVRTDKVVLTYDKRDKTPDELAAESRAARDLVVEIDALAARVAKLETRR